MCVGGFKVLLECMYEGSKSLTVADKYYRLLIVTISYFIKIDFNQPFTQLKQPTSLILHFSTFTEDVLGCPVLLIQTDKKCLQKWANVLPRYRHPFALDGMRTYFPGGPDQAGFDEPTSEFLSG